MAETTDGCIQRSYGSLDSKHQQFLQLAQEVKDMMPSQDRGILEDVLEKEHQVKEDCVKAIILIEDDRYDVHGFPRHYATSRQRNNLDESPAGAPEPHSSSSSSSSSCFVGPDNDSLAQPEEECAIGRASPAITPSEYSDQMNRLESILGKVKNLCSHLDGVGDLVSQSRNQLSQIIDEAAQIEADLKKNSQELEQNGELLDLTPVFGRWEDQLAETEERFIACSDQD